MKQRHTYRNELLCYNLRTVKPLAALEDYLQNNVLQAERGVFVLQMCYSSGLL